ncbi:hypothetical protein [uncultured Phascolarctobacterium sp.]|uniref:hypothetical protein n=1 Tax=uncultured Phascolarctobacterium sp. TaxID=512296 RepID=UPI0025F57FAB|nr:hypothetical protein [uncultured Phascolarctobacterium sp.]
MSENLFAYTATNSGYSQGTAGAINGDRAAAATALTAVKNKITGLNGDPAFFNYFDRNSSRLVLRQYNYTPTSEPNQLLTRRETGPCRYTARGGPLLPICMV